MDILFTGCEHYSHAKIIKFCNRPFSSYEEMNRELILNSNANVDEEDVLYHLGDFCLYGNTKTGNGESISSKDILSQLNGNHIFLEGNHDKGNRNTLKTRNQEIILNQNGLRIQLLHDPLYARIDYDLILHSHVHNSWKVKELYYCGQVRLMINVGVDVNNYKPIALDEVLSIYYRWKKERSRIKRWEQPKIFSELNKDTLSNKS